MKLRIQKKKVEKKQQDNKIKVEEKNVEKKVEKSEKKTDSKKKVEKSVKKTDSKLLVEDMGSMADFMLRESVEATKAAADKKGPVVDSAYSFWDGFMSDIHSLKDTVTSIFTTESHQSSKNDSKNKPKPPKQDKDSTRRAVDVEFNQRIDISDPFLKLEHDDANVITETKKKYRNLKTTTTSDGKPVAKDTKLTHVHEVFEQLEAIDDKVNLY